MFARWSAFLVWALVAASAVAWGLKLFTQPLTAPASAVVAMPSAAAGGDWTRVFGVAPPPPATTAEAEPPPAPESSRFQLIGVVAAYPAAARSQGVALIAIDGKTPRAYRVGAVIDGDQVLLSVQPRGVAIGPRQGPATLTLELPPLPPPATGVPGGHAAGLPPGTMPPPPLPAVAVPGLPPPTAPNLSVPPQQRLRTLGGPVPGQAWPQPVLPPGAPQLAPQLVPPMEPVQTDGGVGYGGQPHTR